MCSFPMFKKRQDYNFSNCFTIIFRNNTLTDMTFGHNKRQEKLRMKNIQSKGHPISEWITELKSLCPAFMLFSFLSLVLGVFFQPESKLEKEWAVWLERPWADSWASVFGCAWQDNFVVSLGLWRTHSQILYTPLWSHIISPLPWNLNPASQLIAS